MGEGCLAAGMVRCGLWDPGRPADLGAELGRHDGEVCTVAVLPDGRVVSGGGDGAVWLWDPGTGLPISGPSWPATTGRYRRSRYRQPAGKSQ